MGFWSKLHVRHLPFTPIETVRLPIFARAAAQHRIKARPRMRLMGDGLARAGYARDADRPRQRLHAHVLRLFPRAPVQLRATPGRRTGH
jgi:hypothetical protein